MSRIAHRSRSLVVLLALSLGLAPTASALCGHLVSHAAEHEAEPEAVMPMPEHAPAEAPCHERPDAPHEPPTDELPADEPPDCVTLCCLAAPSPPAAVTTPPAAANVATVARLAVPIVWLETPVEPTARDTGPVPPRLYLETGRVRV